MAAGTIVWEKRGNGHKIRTDGYVGGVVVASIFKIGNHGKNRNNYDIEVLGVKYTGNFRYIAEAYSACQRIYSSVS